MLSIIPVTGLPEIRRGDRLDELLAERCARDGWLCLPGDILVVTSKVVSKAEGATADLANVSPSAEALRLSSISHKDPRLVELVLRESREVVRSAPNVLIVRHRLGHVMVNAGIDASNTGAGQDGQVLLLPLDPDASARRIADACAQMTGVRPAVLITDSFGRPWRLGTVNVAIGRAGLPALIDQRGESDRDGRKLQVTQVAVADAVAAAAGLVIGEAAEGIPAAVVRGLQLPMGGVASDMLLRPLDEDLFR